MHIQNFQNFGQKTGIDMMSVNGRNRPCTVLYSLKFSRLKNFTDFTGLSVAAKNFSCKSLCS